MTRSRRVLTALALLLAASLSAGDADAKLAPTTLASLLAETELIVEATPLKLERTSTWNRTATLKVTKVVRGSYAEPTITLGWGGEVHEQHIDLDVGSYLLFLRKGEKGGWQAAHYGRSYWPFTSPSPNVPAPGPSVEIVDTTRPEVGFVYTYPVSMVTLSPEQQTELLSFKPVSANKPPWLAYGALRRLLEQPARAR